MPEVVTFPDAELLLVRYLTDALDGDASVVTQVPPDERVRDMLPVVRIGRMGGAWTVRKQLDAPTLDVDIYGDSDDLKAVNDLTGRVRALIEAMTGHEDPTVGGLVTQTTEVAGPRRLPEEDPRLIRTGFTVGLLVRPI